MTIFEQIKSLLDNRLEEIVSPVEVKKTLQAIYGTNPESVILSDYCYNRYNNGIDFNNHLFEYINRSSYKYLGEGSAFTGLIFQRPKGHERETIVGEWINGVKSLYKKTNDTETIVSREQIMNLYNEYQRILRYELNILNCKPTEIRHLIGRVGEFICAIKTNGSLSHQTNQHGFDVISKGRRISVKTTAQKSGFIPINQNTFKDFDDLFIVQYANDDFHVLYNGPKELVESNSRTYNGKYEVNINTIKKLNQERTR
ncbi:hypothetical protein SAMN04489762_3453 [Terribacillus saccharophilus]|uniref:Uncharacterized protein n=1 Tax=Terribacillus saccharophilus TaxID=361277 RepID=A0AAX2EJT9_9BACI|nr:hypothetical protein SAMN04489762_3453 [Terribacillus saccharophilus]